MKLIIRQLVKLTIANMHLDSPAYWCSDYVVFWVYSCVAELE
jgi:hypothetical protein